MEAGGGGGQAMLRPALGCTALRGANGASPGVSSCTARPFVAVAVRHALIGREPALPQIQICSVHKGCGGGLGAVEAPTLPRAPALPTPSLPLPRPRARRPHRGPPQPPSHEFAVLAPPRSVPRPTPISPSPQHPPPSPSPMPLAPPAGCCTWMTSGWTTRSTMPGSPSWPTYAASYTWCACA